MPQRRHIRISKAPTTERYIYPHFVKGPAFDRPKRDRAVHAGLLTQQLKQVRADIVARQPAAAANPEAYGAVLTFKSDPNFKLALDSLENRKQGIQLLNSHFDGTVMIATVHVPPRKMSHFFRLVKAYATKNFVKDGVDTGNPRHRDLIESISEIKLAALRSFWVLPAKAWDYS